MGKVVGYIFNAEAREIIIELSEMRAQLGPGEFFVSDSAQRHDELMQRLGDLVAKS